MFIGTIDKNVREFIAGNKEGFRGQTVVVGCSGNFTSERVLLNECAPAAVHSNDVALYSKLLADAMLDTDTPLTIAEPEYEWLAPYLFEQGPWVRASSLILLLRLLEFEKRHTVYHRQMWRHIELAFDGAVKETADALAQRTLPISSFFLGDVVDHLNAFEDEDAIFTAYFPTIKGGYERLYKRVNQILSWAQPDYNLLDDAGIDKLVAWMRERRHMVYLHRPIPGEEPQMLAHKRRGVWVYIYSNIMQKSALYRRPLPPQTLKWAVTTPDFKFGPDTQIEIVEVPCKEISPYKQLYIKKVKDPVTGTFGCAVLADGKICGFFEVMINPNDARSLTIDGDVIDPLHKVFLLSDFVVTPPPNKRLSKLIPMMALSKDMRRLIENKLYVRQRAVMTIAFTDKPVSMKYRGVMQLAGRGKTQDGQAYITYVARWSGLSIQETYDRWWTKYGKSSKS